MTKTQNNLIIFLSSIQHLAAFLNAISIGTIYTAGCLPFLVILDRCSLFNYMTSVSQLSRNHHQYSNSALVKCPLGCRDAAPPQWMYMIRMRSLMITPCWANLKVGLYVGLKATGTFPSFPKSGSMLSHPHEDSCSDDIAS